MASASSLGEWPSLIRNTFLTQTKNSAGISAVRLFMKGKPYVISVDDSLLFYNETYFGFVEPLFAYLS
jgi:hypothetical protein